jgi:uncharacterized membrane protein
MTTVLYGILSALVWGGGDFAGGLASRKLGAYRAVFYAEVLGLALLLGGLLFFPEDFPDARSLLFAASAGLVGSIGLLILYQAMSIGKMSIAAPVSALLAAAFPVLVAIFTEGMPALHQWGGFALALAAIWLVSQPENGVWHDTHLAELRLPFVAGIAFGAYFVLIHQASTASTLYPMIISRSVGTLMMLLALLLRRESFSLSRAGLPLVSANAALDVGGNTFYILAAQAGRLDVAAVLSSLYPGTTALLAGFFLKERILPGQKMGILLALGAIILLTL